MADKLRSPPGTVLPRYTGSENLFYQTVSLYDKLNRKTLNALRRTTRKLNTAGTARLPKLLPLIKKINAYRSADDLSEIRTIVNELVADGVDLNGKVGGRTPLVHAYDNRKFPVIRLLLNRGANPVGFHGEPLMTLAIDLIDVKLVDTLLRSNALTEIFSQLHEYSRQLLAAIANVDDPDSEVPAHIREMRMAGYMAIAEMFDRIKSHRTLAGFTGQVHLPGGRNIPYDTFYQQLEKTIEAWHAGNMEGGRRRNRSRSRRRK